MSKRLIASSFLFALLASQHIWGQARALRREAIQALVDNHTPDNAVAGEITARGLASPPDDDWIVDLQRRGAGTKTITALSALVPTGTLSIRTSVADSQVLLDGRNAGNSGADSTLRIPGVRFGGHKVLVRKDRYLEAEQQVAVASSEVSVFVTSVSSMGTLTLTSDTAGATISIVGLPPYSANQLRGLSLPAGGYRASVVAPGHRPLALDFVITAGQSTTRLVHLEPDVQLLLSAMPSAIALGQYALATAEATELLTAMPGNGFAYLTLAQTAFYTGDPTAFLQNARNAVRGNVEVPFNLVHTNDKKGAHQVTLRVAPGLIRFDKHGSNLCTLPDIAMMPTMQFVATPGVKGQQLKSQVQDVTITTDRFGMELLDVKVMGHVYQFADVIQRPAITVSRRDEYEVIRSLLMGPRYNVDLTDRQNVLLDRTVAQPVQPREELLRRLGSTPRDRVALLERAQKAMGGADALLGIRSYSSVVEGTFYPHGGKMRVSSWSIGARHLRIDSVLPSGKGSEYTDGRTGWLSMSSSMRPLTLAEISDLFFYQLNTLVMADRNASLTVTSVGPDEVQVSSARGQVATLRFDVLTGLPNTLAWSFVDGSMRREAVSTFSDWREINGIKSPFKQVIEVNGIKSREDVVIDYRVNIELNLDELSRKP